MSGNSRTKVPSMDGETALAFAGHCFEQHHPRSTCPEWLGRCTTIGYTKDNDGKFLVSFSVTPKATNDAVCYFRVSVDPRTANTLIISELDPHEFNGCDLQGFDEAAAKMDVTEGGR